MLKIVTPKGLKAEIKKYFQQKEVKGPFIVAGHTGIGKSAIARPLFYEHGCTLYYEFLTQHDTTDEEVLKTLEKHRGQRGLFERTIKSEDELRFLLDRNYDVFLLRTTYAEWHEWAMSKNREGKQYIDQPILDFLDSMPEGDQGDNVGVWFNTTLTNDELPQDFELPRYPTPAEWFLICWVVHNKVHNLRTDPEEEGYNPNYVACLQDYSDEIKDTFGQAVCDKFYEYCVVHSWFTDDLAKRVWVEGDKVPVEINMTETGKVYVILNKIMNNHPKFKQPDRLKILKEFGEEYYYREYNDNFEIDVTPEELLNVLKYIAKLAKEKNSEDPNEIPSFHRLHFYMESFLLPENHRINEPPYNIDWAMDAEKYKQPLEYYDSIMELSHNEAYRHIDRPCKKQPETLFDGVEAFLDTLGTQSVEYLLIRAKNYNSKKYRIECIKELLSPENLDEMGFLVETQKGSNYFHISRKGKGAQADFDVYLSKKYDEMQQKYEDELYFKTRDSAATIALLKYPPQAISDDDFQKLSLTLNIDKSLLNLKEALDEYFLSVLSNGKSGKLTKIKQHLRLKNNDYLPKGISVLFDLAAPAPDKDDRNLDVVNVYVDKLNAQDLEKYFKLFNNESFSLNNEKFIIHTSIINIFLDKKPDNLSYLQEVSKVLSSHIVAKQLSISILNGESVNDIEEIKDIFDTLLERHIPA